MDTKNQRTPVPDDFPRASQIASLAGIQAKLAVVRDGETGKYFAQHDVVETAGRFEMCDDLAKQLVAKCERNRVSKYVHLTEQQILEQLLNQLLKTDWGTSAEMHWTIRRAAVQLGWAWDK